MSIFSNLFHKHKFDPKGWKCVHDITLISNYGNGARYENGYVKVYTNTCLGCGTLVSKRVSS